MEITSLKLIDTTRQLKTRAEVFELIWCYVCSPVGKETEESGVSG